MKKITDRELIDILEKGADFAKSIMDFNDSMKKWIEYLKQYDEKELVELIDNNPRLAILNKTIVKEFEKIEGYYM